MTSPLIAFQRTWRNGEEEEDEEEEDEEELVLLLPQWVNVCGVGRRCVQLCENGDSELCMKNTNKEKKIMHCPLTWVLCHWWRGRQCIRYWKKRVNICKLPSGIFDIYCMNLENAFIIAKQNKNKCHHQCRNQKTFLCKRIQLI